MEEVNAVLNVTGYMVSAMIDQSILLVIMVRWRWRIGSRIVW